MFEIFKPGLYVDFMGKMRLLTGLSAAVVVASIAIIGVRGINFGLDFVGGYEVEVKLPHPVGEPEIKGFIAPLGVEDARVQRTGDQSGDEYLIFVRQHGTLKEADKAAIKKDIEALASGPENIAALTMAESGETLHVELHKPVAESDLRALFERRGLPIKSFVRSAREDAPTYDVEVVSLSSQIEQSLIKGLGLPADADIVRRVEFVGPQVGSQLRTQGLLALLAALGFLLLYVAVRFDFYFSPGAIVALMHDVIVTLGVYALFQIEFTMSTIAALLTIIGYSINDTIVVYDRVRENIAKLRGRELRHLVSTSVSETLSRTVLTSSTIAVVIALIIFGGRDLADFSVALLVGFVAGTYSSFSSAAPLYVVLRERFGARAGGASASSTAAAG